MPSKERYNFFSTKNKSAIRKAFSAGRRTVLIDEKRFNIEKAPGKRGKPFIMITPVNGTLPMGQIEIRDLGSTKLEHVKESLKKATKRR